jgi:hypothetical protein
MAFLIGKQVKQNLKRKYNYHKTDAPQQTLTSLTNFKLDMTPEALERLQQREEQAKNEK